MKNYLKIDFELFKDARLNNTDIIILAYFSSFEKCFTNNETLKETFGLTERLIQHTITKLKRLEYIKVKVNKRHKRREITSILYKPNKKVKSQEWTISENEDLTEEEKKQAEELSARLLGKK